MTRRPVLALLGALALPGCSDEPASAAAPVAPADASAAESSADAPPGDDADAGAGDGSAPDGSGLRVVKVVIVNMALLEGRGFVDALGLTEKVPVSGLPKESPDLLCNADDVCELTTGMGYANAAASMSALIYRGGLDLTRAYFVIAGIAGMDPAEGTVGSAAWARFAVDYGNAQEIDAREMPAGWPYGYLGIGAASPSDPPVNDYEAAVYQLDEDLLQAALALSKDAVLEDSAQAIAFRANFPTAPANEPPKVIQCDVGSSDTWFAGTTLSLRARDWTKLLTNGKGRHCMSAQEDNATLEVIERASAAGKVDRKRVAVLRTASDMAAPYPGQTEVDSLVGSLAQGGLTPSYANLYTTAGPLIDAITSDWAHWASGVPKP